jgi:putative DNA primase/helicase
LIRRHPKPILKRKGAHVSTDDNLDDRDPAWENSGWGEAACEYHGARSKAPNGPRTGVADLVDSLARKKCTEYDLVRGQHAEALGIRKSTLDREVAARRKELEQHELELPAHWHVVMLDQEVDGAELLDQIRSVFRRYIVLPPGADIALALWVLHAWTHEVCEISPILCLQSPTKRCGKTNVMILVHYLTPRSELAANVSTASIFRYIEAMHPTLLIDEADSFLSDNDEMRGILNAGHTKAGSGVIRVEEVNGSHVAKRYSTWAPKAIALIKNLPDTLADRSVTVHLMRKPPGALVQRLRKRDCREFETLRGRAARWAHDHSDSLSDPDPKIPDSLHDRAADNWRPLLAIADLAGGHWPQLARQAACQLTGAEQEGAIGVTLLSDIRSAFGDAEVMRSADLVAKLAADPESLWAEYNRGQPMTQRNLARQLGHFGIITETVHPPGSQHGKGYKRASFAEVWAAYCPDLTGQNVSSNPPPTSQACERANADGSGLTRDFSSVREQSSARIENADLSHSQAGLHACTDKSGQEAKKSGAEQANGASTHHPVCAYCGSADPTPNQVSLGGENPWLHRNCETAWLNDGLAIPSFLARGQA